VTTLTITNAKKNLGKWLSAAVNGQEIGIVSGATIVALRPVEIEPADYAWREYGLNESALDAFIRADNKRIAATQKADQFMTLPANPEEALEKIFADRSRRAKTASRPAAKRTSRRRSQAA
jgi:antitoxin (DNA-binding transcriptional repressor) of toxin-antitoxin stability system